MINLGFWWALYMLVGQWPPYDVAPPEAAGMPAIAQLFLAVLAGVWASLVILVYQSWLRRRAKWAEDMTSLRKGEGDSCKHGIKKWKRCRPCAQEAFPPEGPLKIEVDKYGQPLHPPKMVIVDEVAYFDWQTQLDKWAKIEHDHRPSKIDVTLPVEKKLYFDLESGVLYGKGLPDSTDLWEAWWRQNQGEQRWPLADNRYDLDPTLWRDRAIYKGTETTIQRWARLKASGGLYKVERCTLLWGRPQVYTISRDYSHIGKQYYQFPADYLEQAVPRDGERWRWSSCTPGHGVIQPIDFTHAGPSGEGERLGVRCGCLVPIL